MGCGAGDRLVDRRDHSRKGVPHLAVPEPQDDPSALLELGGAVRVLIGANAVLAAIDLDGDLQAPAGEVENEAVNNELPGEARPLLAKHAPQQTLLERRSGAQATRVARQLRRNPLHRRSLATAPSAATHPRPLPCREGR